MQISDEMVGLAAQSDAKFDGHDDFTALSRTQRERYIARSRAALEAALGVKRGNASELVNSLIGWANVLEILSGKYVNEDCRKAAACIEDLAAALNRIERWEGGPLDQGANGSRDYFCELAHAVLEKWGLK